MFDIDFAYSGTMQFLLFLTSCMTTLCFYTFITNIVLLLYGEKVSLIRKAAFVFISGIVLNTFWIYGIYYIGGMLDFSTMVYHLVTVPNPVFAVLFFYLGVKILGLSPYSSVRLLTNTYIFIIAVKSFHRMIGFALFPQTGETWNYLSDMASLIVNIIIFTVIYLVLKNLIPRSAFAIRLTDSSQPESLRKEVMVLILKTSAIYVFSVFYPIYVNKYPNIYLLIMFIVLLGALLLNLLNDAQISGKRELINKSVHTKILNDVIDDFSGLRHDFNNIMQVYSGYLAAENYEQLKKYHQSMFNAVVLLNENILLNDRLDENPALVSLLLEKYKLAASAGVSMRMNIICGLAKWPITPFDLCRVVGNLLDNAIQAAADSEKKWVSISIEQPKEMSKLMIIANSTKEEVNIAAITRPGTTSKAGHAGIGLHHTRKILNKYAHCTFQLSYYDHEFTAYVDIAGQ